MSVRQGKALLASGFGGLLVFFVVIGLRSTFFGEFVDAAEASERDPLVETVLLRVGLSPENLAAASVPATSMSSVVQGVGSYLNENPTELNTCDNLCHEWRATRDRLRRKVRSGLASEQEVQEYQGATQALENAESGREAELNRAFSNGVGSLSADEKARLEKVIANSGAWNLPGEFLVIDRDQAEWVRLRDALANERVSTKLGENPDAEDQSYLATERADASVAAAKVFLDANFAAVRQAWEDALGV